MNKLKKIILAGLLLAASVVFSRFFSIKTPIMVISFGFIPKLIIATLFGPWWSILLFGLTDLIGSLLFPFGAYFVGYTISACLSGFIYGILLHRKKPIPAKKYLLRLVIAFLLSKTICGILLNSVWIVITTKKAIMAILPARIAKDLITIPVYVAIMLGIHVFFEKYKIYDLALNSRSSLGSEISEKSEEAVEKEAIEENGQSSESKTESDAQSPTEVHIESEEIEDSN